MKHVIRVYKKHQLSVDNFLITLVKSFPKEYVENGLKIVKNNEFVELMYAVDSTYHQISPTICRKTSDTTSLGAYKSHYFVKMLLDEEGFYISNPYIHYRTGKASLSIVRSLDGVYYVFDVSLVRLLEELKFIEHNTLHDRFKKSVYTLGSLLLALIAIALMGYGVKIFVGLLIAPHEFLHDIFKSIIAATLGLAMYDLARQIFEHEVLFHTFHHDETQQYKVLGKFLISIMIALSIETLMVVFKIALNDYTQMLSAFYLLIGTTVMMMGLAYFYKTIRSVPPHEEE